jgi:hypothetical protein
LTALLLAGAFDVWAAEPLAVPAPTWNAAFERSEGWTGADVASSVDLGDGRTLWLFSDTWIGHIADGKHGPGSYMVNNSIGVQRMPSRAERNAIRPPPVQFLWGAPDADGKATAWLVPDPKKAGAREPVSADSSTTWLWFTGKGLVAPSAAGEKRLVLFLTELAPRPGQTDAFGFRAVGGVVAVIENYREPAEQWRVRQYSNPHAVGVDRAGRTTGRINTVWGVSICYEPETNGDWVYLYGVRETSPLNKRLLLARVPPERIEQCDAWQFYASDSKWSPRFTDAVPIAERVSSEVSINRLSVHGRERLVMIHEEPGFAKRILLRTSNRLEGPWSAPIEIYTVPESLRHTYLAYAAKGHPHLSADGELLVSYVVNSTDQWTMAADAGIYWPRFIRVRLERLPSSLGDP